MRKIVATMAVVLAFSLGGCGSAAADAAGKETVKAAEVGTGDAESDAGETDGNEEQRKESMKDEESASGKAQDGKNGAQADGSKEDGADGSVADAKGKEDALEDAKESSGAQGKPGTGEKAAQETTKPKLADYEITVFGETAVMYASSPVNVRKGPAVDFDRVGGLLRGQQVTVTGQADTGWYEISYGKEKAYVSGRYLQKEKPQEEPEGQQTEGASEAGQQEANGQAAGEAQPSAEQQGGEAQPSAEQQGGQAQPSAEQQGEQAQQAAVQNAAGVIMVGDSRFVQMQQSVGENSCTWIAESGKGYNWFSDTAIARIDGCVGKGSKVLINLGVNDPGHLNDYLALVNAKAAEWAGKGAAVYYASVNPVWDNPYVTEEQVEYFNSQMQAGLSPDVHWIDSHSYLNSVGYKLVDGLHFSTETNQNLYAYYMGCL